MKKINRLILSLDKGILLIAAFLMLVSVAFSQVTTSGMNGKITGENGGSLPGATILAIHTPTGTQFGTTTDAEGFYRLPNMNIGGPYKVTISFVGYKTYVRNDIYLTLGQTYKLNVNLSEAAAQLKGVEVIAKKRDIIDGNRTGAETVVGRQSINLMPTVTRDINDFTRLTPQASVNDYGAISIAGINNRYNAISIDGAVNNDVFGLAANGQNGGQTGGTPISIDAIKQFQIVLAPYDVRQSGFAGGGINAVTRSGSNKFKGSAYYFFRNQDFAGKTPTKDPDITREKLPEFTAKTYGLRLGGPIMKNKLFFFLNAEFQRDETPQPFTFSDYEGNSSMDDINAFITKLKGYGYDPGGFLNNTRKLEGDKLLARFDWNISKIHKLTFRHSYTKNVATMPSRSSTRSISFYNNGEYFPSITNSTALELKSNFSDMSNHLTIGYTTVRDDRDPMGANFPALRIYDGNGTIYAGSEPYSTANELNQDILTITDNFSIYKGKHTITFGTSNEFGSVYNLFMRKNFGEYRYSNMSDFLNDSSAYQYERGYSLVDNITGDGSKAAADFKMMQLGFYVQDEFQVNDNLKLTGGIRVDVPIFSDNPKEDVHFNDSTLTKIEADGWDMQGARAGKMPKSQLLWAPRLGFNWDVNGDKTFQLRGGLGIFTSRLPLVWPGGSYTNNGLTIGGVYVKKSWGYNIPFESRWDHQYNNAYFGGTDAPYGGQMDLFASNFKFPQIFRTNIGIDKKLPWGIVGTFEFIYSKTLNNVLYYNVNVHKNKLYDLTGADNRPYYSNEKLDNAYTRVIVGTNTNKGYTYNVTAQLQKPFENGIIANLAYTFGRAKALNDATSSQNSSQWRYMENVNGLNNLDLSYSDFDLGSRILAFVSYKFNYFNHFASTLSLVYNGQSGQRFSYVYNDWGNLNGEGENAGNLIYVPKDASEINFVGTADEQAQQWADLDDFIKNDNYLKNRRGEYAERNAARLPFENILDLRFAQDFYVNAAERKQTLQLTLDIFNFANLLNKDWGRRYYIPYGAYQLIKFKGFKDDGTTPQFSFDKPKGDVWSIDDSGVKSSRWQAQIGIRYIF